MEEFEILKKLPRVEVPPDFERRVMACLAERKAARANAAPFRARIWLAAVPAALLAAVLLINVFVLRQPGFTPGQADERRAGALTGGSGRDTGVIAVMEPLDYRQDMRNFSDNPGTVYILENISDEIHQEIRY